MTRFLAILNAKKDKISKLKEELVLAKVENQQKRPRNRNVDDEYGADTDEEDAIPEPSKKKSTKKTGRPTDPIPSLKAMIDAQERR